MLKKLRKSSGHVTLVLIGLTTLAGCAEDDARRDVYKTREDCLADWGNKVEDCKPATESRHSSRGYWYGPSHSSGGWSSRSSPRSIGSHSSGSHGSVSRGGFGSSAHSSGG